MTPTGHAFHRESHRCITCGKHQADATWAEDCPR